MEMVLAHRRAGRRLPDHLRQSPARAAAKNQRDGLCLVGRAGLYHSAIFMARRLAPLRRLQRPECVRGFRRMEIRLSSILLAAALLLLSGCSWFHRGHKAPAEVVVDDTPAEPTIV